MKIKSKFKDYYDHIQQFGQGDDVLYVRNAEVYCFPDRPSLPGWYRVERDNDGIDRMVEPYKMKSPITNVGYNLFTVYFCGKEYYGLKVEQASDRHGNIIPEQFFYDADKYKHYFEKTNPDPSYRDYYGFKSRVAYLISNGRVNNMNQILGRPVIMVKYDWYNGLYNIYNPRLYEVEFQKAVDPYTAFMELDMFISGVLGKTGGEMVTISDKDKIDKHGFDAKYGFRTRPKEKV